jgi:dihydrofolate reductase
MCRSVSWGYLVCRVLVGYTGRDIQSEEATMRKVVVSEFVTLDGVMEELPSWTFRSEGEEQQKFKFDELSASDALLLGRVTYEGFAAAWPSVTDEEGFAEMMNGYPKYVVSTTLQEPLEWNARLIKGDLAEEVLRLKQEPGKDILVYGSGDLVNALMKHNLVDEYRLMVFPIVVGSGKRLLEGEIDTTVLELVDSKTFSSGVVVLTYQPAGR